MVDEVETQFERAVAVGHLRGGQAARADVEGDVPPVVDQWGKGQTYLADHLRPHVQRRAGVFPRAEGQSGPALRQVARGWIHSGMLPQTGRIPPQRAQRNAEEIEQFYLRKLVALRLSAGIQWGPRTPF